MTRPSALLVSRLGVAAGGVLVTIGMGLAVGLAAALITAGILLAGGCMVLIDVDDRKEGRR